MNNNRPVNQTPETNYKWIMTVIVIVAILFGLYFFFTPTKVPNQTTTTYDTNAPEASNTNTH